MKMELHDYDVFPMVFLTENEETITVRGKNRRCFPDVDEVFVTVKEIAVAEDWRFSGSNGSMKTKAKLDKTEDGFIQFKMTFPHEGEYYICLAKAENENEFVRFNVFALEHDMAGRYPFRGDLHMHTNGSDGHEDSPVTASNYRGHGYDFTVISDHYNYYPSLVARKKFHIGLDDQSDLTDMLIVQGEEVHMPLNDVHYVNFGGKYSINALVVRNGQTELPKEKRSLNGECPETMTEEEFCEMIKKDSDGVDRAIASERYSYSVLKWTYEHIRKNGGLGIFPHPYWRCSTMQLSENYLYYIYENKPFDAFEVLGGERYYQHNGFQTAFYYEERAKGYHPPIVGSTDSHGSTENNPGGLICSTIVFAPVNTTDSLITSIKDKYSVAIDSISAEYRLVGDFRFIKYGSFLLENWYPLHDAACQAEGYYMNEYVSGNPAAENVLRAMKGQIPGMFKKYFHI